MFRKSSYSFSNGSCLEFEFTKSSHSNYNGSCLEATHRDGTVRVHDTKHCADPEHCGAVQEYTPGEWDAFIKGVKDGEFDLP